MGSAASSQAALRDASEAELLVFAGAVPELLRSRLPPQQLRSLGEAFSRVAREEEPQDLRAEWQRPSSWPAKKSVPSPAPDAQHVVLSTKFQEPWLTISIGLKEILVEKGCTVYNPNTDNAEIYKEEADSRWLLTFNENLERVKKTKGFVLQIQQGVQQERSYMQLAEEKQSAWLQVPRIGYFAFANSKQRGGGTAAEELMASAMEAATRQWATKIRSDVEMVCEVYEPLEGTELPLDKKGQVHGRARCKWPSGDYYEGEFRHGKVHGRGINKFADGAVYEGEFQKGNMHGRGVCKYVNGNVYEGEYEEDQRHGRGIYTCADGTIYEGEYKEDKKHGCGMYKFPHGDLESCHFEKGSAKGPGVRLSADRKRAYLLKDGKKDKEQKLSVSEARQKAKELGLPELPP